MRAVIQRVTRAAVRVGDATVGEVGPGLCVLLSVGHADTEATADHLAGRVATLRILPDKAGRMNLSLSQTGSGVLVVSQFTLHADTSRGHRPSFLGAAAPESGHRLYQRFVEALRGRGLAVATGEFGAHMTLDLDNNGPVTLVVTSGEPAWNADAG